MGDSYIGLISGTSMDGIDAALVSFGDAAEVLHTHEHNYPDELRERLQDLKGNPSACSLDEVGELNTFVGECFRDAALALLESAGKTAGDVRAIGCHGQTVRHRPDVTHRFTTQLGDASIIATGTGIDTVADFRTTDMALGGQGAPLTPPFHDWAFRDSKSARVILNIGGIANVTVLPAGDNTVTGFDTGPGNTLMDAWFSWHNDAPYDDGGKWAASGKLDDELLERLLSDSWFGEAPPKSTGFEHFNLGWLGAADDGGNDPADVQATLCELTAVTIADAIRDHAAGTQEVLVCGGGIHNDHLMDRLRNRLGSVDIDSTAKAGIDPDWVEAAAFAWLAMRRLEGKPGNLPAVTGATREAVLGAVYAAP